jgi:hypothetical protein
MLHHDSGNNDEVIHALAMDGSGGGVDPFLHVGIARDGSERASDQLRGKIRSESAGESPECNDEHGQRHGSIILFQ